MWSVQVDPSVRWKGQERPKVSEGDNRLNKAGLKFVGVKLDLVYF